MNPRAFCAALVALLVAGCTTDAATTEPPAQNASATDVELAPRRQESQEFSGRLPISLRGINVTSGTSNFTAQFNRPFEWATVEIVVSPDRIEAFRYVMTLKTGDGKTIESEIDAEEPHVLHTDLPGPYEVELRATGFDPEGTPWAANVTIHYREGAATNRSAED